MPAPARGMSSSARRTAVPMAPHSGGGERLRLLLQHEVIPHLVERRGERFAGRGLAGRLLHEFDDQGLFHAVDDVGLDEFVALLKQMGDAGVIAGRGRWQSGCARAACG